LPRWAATSSIVAVALVASTKIASDAAAPRAVAISPSQWNRR